MANYGGKPTIRQMAYARGIMGAEGSTKQQIALNSGYTPNVARSVASHIETKPGFHNAMAQLAVDSNNLALAAMEEFKARGFKGFSNKELTNALQVIGSSWEKFNAPMREKKISEGGNKLRSIVLQQVENQTVNTTPQASPTVVADDKPPTIVGEVCDIDDPMDF